jgi:hypothetical protein
MMPDFEILDPIVERMKADMNARYERMIAIIKTGLEEMRSVAERQVPSGALRRRHRGRNLSEGRRREPKELTRGDCGSRRNLAAACRKVSRRAAMAQRRRKVFR